MVNATQPANHVTLRSDYDKKLDALQREVAALRRAGAGRRPGAPRRARLVAALAVALLVALVPLGLLAANPFNDLNPGSVHNANIDAIFEAGITKGCDPGVAFCPNANVTREEMASFLARTAGLGDNPPVANAKTAQTAQTATSAQNAAHATTADTATTATNAVNAQTATTAGTASELATSPAGGVMYAANDLIRVASARGTDNLVLSGTRQTVATLILDAPARGFILLNGTLGLGIFPDNTNVKVQFAWVDIAHGTSAFVSEVSARQASGESLEFTVSPNAIFPIDGSGPQTYQLVAQIVGGTGSPRVFVPNIIGLYVPFGATGGTTLEAK